MRKAFLLLLMIALFGVMTPVMAQEDETPTCSEDDLSGILEAITTLSESFIEAEANIADVTDPDGVTEAVLSFDAIASGFWNETYSELPDCYESNAIAYAFGLALDETLLNSAMLRLALYERDYGDPDIAQSYADYIASRAERYAEIIANSFGVMAETGEIPETMLAAYETCTEEDRDSESASALGASIEAYQAVGQSGDTSSIEGLRPLIDGYAGVTSVHWLEIYPQLPACYEIGDFGQNIGLIYDGTLIAAVLRQLSLYEAEFGDADTATLLDEAAAARQEMLQLFFESAFPQSAE